MSTKSFEAPLTQELVVSKNEGPDGEVNSESILLRDNKGEFYALTIKTDANYVSSIRDPADMDPADREPVFVVPAGSIGEEIVGDIISGVHPRLLNYYLVHQVPGS